MQSRSGLTAILNGNMSDNSRQTETEPKPPKAGKNTSKKAKQGTLQHWTFPKNSLEDAIEVAKVIEEKNAGKPMAADMLVKAIGFHQTSDWRYKNIVRSANQYGLVSGVGEKATVKLEKIGQDVVAPSSPNQRQAALLAAFRNVEDFKKVDDYYKGKNLPDN